MKEKIYALFTLTLISANGFAAILDKGQITQQKEWSTGNVTAYFKDENPSASLSEMKAKKINTKVDSKENSKNDLFAYTHANPATVTAGSILTLTGDALVNVTNNTTKIVDYSVSYSLCACEPSSVFDDCTPMPGVEGCGLAQTSIELAPGGSFSKRFNSVVSSQKVVTTGHYNGVATVAINATIKADNDINYNYVTASRSNVDVVGK